MKIAHTSDSHLDDRALVAGKIVLDDQGRNIRSQDRIRCFRSVAEESIARGCDLILHAGDLFEHNKPTPAEYCAAEEILDLWSETPLVLLADNHGSVESATERHAIEPLIGRRPNLYVSVRPELLTIPTAAGPVQVCTLPSPRRSIVAAKDEYRGLSPEGINALISDKLRGIIRNFRGQIRPEIPAVLMFHGKLIGAWLTDLQQVTGTEQIALTPEDLAGWDYVALGDFHGWQQVAETAWYSGSSDRVDFSEEHQTKGWICAELVEHTAGKTVVHELVETPARRFVTLDPDELINSQPHPEIIYRVKAKLGQEAYDALAPHLVRWRQSTPLFSEQIEITRITRARSEEMTGDLSAEKALRIWHETNARGEDLEALLEAHREIAGR